MNVNDYRDQIVDRLGVDLIGPHEDAELLPVGVRPSDLYLTGLLWPFGNRMSGEDDDDSDTEDDDGTVSTGQISGAQRPCSLGISFSLHGITDAQRTNFRVSIEFGTYFPEPCDPSENPSGRLQHRWRRRAWAFTFNICLDDEPLEDLLVRAPDLLADVRLAFRVIRQEQCNVVTITLVNQSKEQGGRDESEQLTLFQTQVMVRPNADSEFVPRPNSINSHDPDQQSTSLLYRNSCEYATGHQCSSSWDLDNQPPEWIKSSWIPARVVPAYRELGDDVFRVFIDSGFSDAMTLATASVEDLVQGLRGLVHAYDLWISRESMKLADLNSSHQSQAQIHLEDCRKVSQRISRSISLISNNESLRLSFQLANFAMDVQHCWKGGDNANVASLRWRPFQLGFLLLCLPSACIDDHVDRNVMDLLWFPTGGGKTEAYLALIAATAWYRRFTHAGEKPSGGNVAVMRYTLRLLTAQQFERASAVILACEGIRSGAIESPFSRSFRSFHTFSIGLWVGSEATPNDFDTAIRARSIRDGSTAEQLAKCPCCKSEVSYDYCESTKSVHPFCINNNCDLGPRYGKWPVLTVDEDIYRVCPTLLIGTVDKFAQLPFRSDVGTLFGAGTDATPDLIVQDELHLISGPLGTVTGLYETAFDWICTRDGRRPKVVGSTATIRRASDQVLALFDRNSCQFPPPGIDYDNSGFAVVDYEKVDRWRLYLAVTSSGRSAKFTLQAAVGSLLQSTGRHGAIDDEIRSGYSTMLAYFNSLRELGGAIVQMLDDVPDSIKLYASMRGAEPVREIGVPRELTSRVSQAEIIQILEELKCAPPDPDAVDLVLATNMVSVGVDVPRLGLMVLNGQPKTRSEYIQATSRVGRSVFPGLVVSVMNAQKIRDRSHYETFFSWHGALYRDVEATSVTPFSSRARDRALRAVFVSMLRHTVRSLRDLPTLDDSCMERVADVIEAIEGRVSRVDPRELAATRDELDQAVRAWLEIDPQLYKKSRGDKGRSLMQSAEDYARRASAGKSPGLAWPIMNSMRSVEPTTRFRLAEVLTNPAGHKAGDGADAVPPWRRAKSNG